MAKLFRPKSSDVMVGARAWMKPKVPPVPTTNTSLLLRTCHAIYNLTAASHTFRLPCDKETHTPVCFFKTKVETSPRGAPPQLTDASTILNHKIVCNQGMLTSMQRDLHHAMFQVAQAVLWSCSVPCVHNVHAPHAQLLHKASRRVILQNINTYYNAWCTQILKTAFC